MCIQFRTFRGIYIKHRTEKTKMYQPITLLLVTGFNNNGCKPATLTMTASSQLNWISSRMTFMCLSHPNDLKRGKNL